MRQPHHPVAVAGFSGSAVIQSFQLPRRKHPTGARDRGLGACSTGGSFGRVAPQRTACRQRSAGRAYPILPWVEHQKSGSPPRARSRRDRSAGVPDRPPDAGGSRAAPSAAAAPAAAQVGPDRRHVEQAKARRELQRRHLERRRPPGSPRRRARARRCSRPPRRRDRPRSAPPPAARRPRRAPASGRARRAAASSPTRSSWPSAWNGISISSAPSSVQALRRARLGLRRRGRARAGSAARSAPGGRRAAATAPPLTTTRTGFASVDARGRARRASGRRCAPCRRRPAPRRPAPASGAPRRAPAGR